ncbi:2-amino-4-hydroxy-6-hydroxymethyldihydropteridine diphosphokinase [Sphingomonas sp. Leaf25]|uniref:2-amino-4-hydroxy-6- hydroxymethyldihydropteridine diphosphokinase n=1 Tax=Sphingomonas sp. Leaf25 TaxID=1735692 RepID=UPI0006F8D991|nr:2-amino-4-hydroxy-6-hydroxymethyldihydropteridine diphosphokinase [Sphingomonas sp. Leaf25]KQM98833.1 7,8-dihydro-6-hydroxymethylpterin-pyrophosphokinase [Sphingomonas sp. Leaf25]
MSSSTYAIAIGSNRCGRHGGPVAEVRAAVAALDGVRAVAPVMASAPLGPSLRRYANTVAIIESALGPAALLDALKAIERRFGRRRGRRWGSRVIDLDIILWSGGCWRSPGLVVPHLAFRERAFVLRPLAAIAAGWRDPVSGRSVRQLQQMVDHGRRRA